MSVSFVSPFTALHSIPLMSHTFFILKILFSENQSMQFGGMVSTSNSYAPDAQEVTVSTEQPLLWTMGIQTLTSEGHNGS